MNHHQQNGSIRLDSDLHSTAVESESRIRVDSRRRRPARNRIVVIATTIVQNLGLSQPRRRVLLGALPPLALQ
ncbi:hypothetical protein TgHK011_003079 [Trichoderma gracile]|nr:hypothetical protein TgHK011_003079 [Trichoderma gracile]